MPYVPDAEIKCRELARFAAAKGLIEPKGRREPTPRTLFTALEAAGGPKTTTMRDSLSKEQIFSDANAAALLRFLGLAAKLEDFPAWAQPLEGENAQAKALFFRKKLSPHRRLPRLAAVTIDEARNSSNAERDIHVELTFNQITPPEPEDGQAAAALPLEGYALCLAEAALALEFSEPGMRARRGSRLQSKADGPPPLSEGAIRLETVMSAERPVWLVRAPEGERLFGTVYTVEAPLLTLEGAPIGAKATAYLTICGKDCTLRPVAAAPSVDLASLSIAQQRILCVLESKAVLEDDESFTQIVHDHAIEMRDHDQERQG